MNDKEFKKLFHKSVKDYSIGLRMKKRLQSTLCYIAAFKFKLKSFPACP